MSSKSSDEVFVPCRGEVWQVDLKPTRGGEQTKERPCVVLSEKEFNANPLYLCFVAPITSQVKDIPWHIPFHEGQVTGSLEPGTIQCDHARSLAYKSEDDDDRFVTPRGRIEDQSVMRRVSEMLGGHILRAPVPELVMK